MSRSNPPGPTVSLENRAAVLQAAHLNSEYLRSDIFYVGLVGYVLFTRSLADLSEYAWPVFLVLFAGYQIAGLIVRIVGRRLPDIWDLLYWTGGTFIFAAGYVLAMYGIVAIAIDTWVLLNAVWTKLDPLRDQSQFTVVTGLMTLSFGGMFFLFRLRQRFLYGCTEAAAGVLVGMHRVTLEQWSGVPRSSGFYLALLTAGVYLVVRGLDNIHQARRDGDVTLKRIARLIHIEKPTKPIRRLPSSRVVRRSGRREQVASADGVRRPRPIRDRRNSA